MWRFSSIFSLISWLFCKGCLYDVMTRQAWRHSASVEHFLPIHCDKFLEDHSEIHCYINQHVFLKWLFFKLFKQHQCSQREVTHGGTLTFYACLCHDHNHLKDIFIHHCLPVRLTFQFELCLLVTNKFISLQQFQSFCHNFDSLGTYIFIVFTRISQFCISLHWSENDNSFFIGCKCIMRCFHLLLQVISTNLVS